MPHPSNVWYSSISVDCRGRGRSPIMIWINLKHLSASLYKSLLSMIRGCLSDSFVQRSISSMGTCRLKMIPRLCLAKYFWANPSIANCVISCCKLVGRIGLIIIMHHAWMSISHSLTYTNESTYFFSVWACRLKGSIHLVGCIAAAASKNDISKPHIQNR